ncbi:MFS transporter [Macrococcoides caseolyticum]|uniref:MFS transporter n=1 Tax=Macrococcoides caseolyticum TaxID=69966 RepID=UPI001F1C768C|nr:MFS transporter [Macrococcus caseolyticus]MCE4956822.1 MFS transporter [Macrococcus caseolyticus]
MKRFSPIIITLLVATFITRFSMFMVMPFLSIYLINTYHYSGLQIGIILSVAGIVAIILSMTSGSIIDRFNKRYVIYFGLMIGILSYLAFPMIHTFSGFILFSITSTISNTLVEPTYRVFIAEFTADADKKLIFNIRYYLINVAAAIGPYLSSQIQWVGINNLFYIVVAALFINLLLFIYIFNKNDLNLKTNQTVNNIPFFNMMYIFKQDKAFLYLVIGNIFIVFGYTQMMSSLSIYLSKIYPYQTAIHHYAILTLVNSIAVITLQYFVYKIGQHIKTSTSIIIGAILLPLGLILVGISPGLLNLCIAMFILTVGEIFVFTMWDLRIDELSPKALKGSYYALTGLTGISRIIAPLVGGLLIDTISNGFLIWGVIGAITYISVFFFIKSGKQTAAKH